MKVKVIGRTIQTCPEHRSIDNLNEYITNPNIIQKESRVIAGKAAGICYMPDTYEAVPSPPHSPVKVYRMNRNVMIDQK